MNIDALVESFYKTTEHKDLINEVLKFLLVEQGDQMPPKATFEWSMIPDIPISEIGWSDVSTTEEGEQILGPQRALLQQYLDNIGTPGASFAEQIASLEEFYTNGPEGIVGSATSNTEKISKLISYLVFYKTLTKVVTNFNASSAGFSFESFLATLLHGEQIKANTGTIADFLTGDNVPISLKLYAEKTLHVEGSFTDLVNDLVDPQFTHPDGNAMRYVVCTKSFDSDSGEGLKQKGTITFYEFDFTLDNLFAILATSMEKSQKCIHLPVAFVQAIQRGEGDFDYSASLPAKDVLPSPEELEKQFISIARRRFDNLVAHEHPLYPSEEEFQDMLQLIDFAKNEELFTAIQKGDIKQVVRGSSPMGLRKLQSILKGVYLGRENAPRKVVNKDIEFLAKNVFLSAYNEIVSQYKASEMAKLRKQAIVDTPFVTDVGELVRFYGALSDEEKKLALKNTLGYMESYQFALNRRQSTNPSPPINTEKLGVITIGGEYVERMLQQVSSVLNSEIFAVFTSLKTLSDSLNGFFAGGLADDSKASTAIASAQDIEVKTSELKDEK